MKIVIPTKGRAAVIRDKSLRLFPDALLCVGESERDVYGCLSKNLLVHPDSVVGIGPLRQWILDNVDDPTVVMVDDDISLCYSQVGFHKRRITDADTCRAIVERMAILAQDAGVRVFGFQQAARPFTYANFRPFSVNTWVGGIIGINGRELRFDTNLLLRADIDFCLQSLLRDRYVLVDGRYSFIHVRFAGSGGNASNRSSERHEQEIAYLRRKWGPYLDVVQAKGTTRICVRVVREIHALIRTGRRAARARALRGLTGEFRSDFRRVWKRRIYWTFSTTRLVANGSTRLSVRVFLGSTPSHGNEETNERHQPPGDGEGVCNAECGSDTD